MADITDGVVAALSGLGATNGMYGIFKSTVNAVSPLLSIRAIAYTAPI